MDELRESLRPLARELLPPPRERHDAAIRSSFDASGAIRSSALRYALPPLMLTWYLPGSITVGNNVSAEIPLAGPARFVALTVRAKTAPSSTCKLRLATGGNEIVTVQLPNGQKSVRISIPADTATRVAGEVIQLDVVNAGGAQNVTAIAAYTVAE